MTPAEFQKETNTQLRATIGLIDSKISIMGAATLGSFIFNLNLSKDLVFEPGHAGLSSVTLFMFTAGAWIGCGAALFFALSTLWARTLSGNADGGLLSFIDINGHSSVGAYQAAIAPLDDAAMARELAGHNFDLARIISIKVRWANLAIGSLAVGIACTALSVADIALSRGR